MQRSSFHSTSRSLRHCSCCARMACAAAARPAGGSCHAASGSQLRRNGSPETLQRALSREVARPCDASPPASSAAARNSMVRDHALHSWQAATHSSRARACACRSSAKALALSRNSCLSFECCSSATAAKDATSSPSCLTNVSATPWRSPRSDKRASSPRARACSVAHSSAKPARSCSADVSAFVRWRCSAPMEDRVVSTSVRNTATLRSKASACAAMASSSMRRSAPSP
mmetsp:Transcript_59323/g.165633  ORF Transcript_59323/g.165633 Transcript_59323/m.165633 type:complete len:230 (-) Transcript_59323:866-1555(-)